jgi:tetratricopeptide (TPR) repeat protein
MTNARTPPARSPRRAAGTAKEIARLLAEGVRLHRRGELRRADACYRRALRLDPRQADALHLAGLIAHQTGDQSEALTLIEQALAIDSRQAPFHNSQGVVLLALDRLAEAEAAFERALDHDPLYAEALNNLGNALQRQERNGEAVAAYDRAVEALPAYAEAWCNRGRALHLDGRPGDAMASLRKALVLRPGWAKAMRWLGDAAAAAGDLSEAEACYRRAAAFDPADAESAASLAALLERGNRLEEALAAADTAIAADVSILRASVTAARVLRRQGRPEQALARLRESATSAAPTDERAAAAFERGQILDRLGDYRQAYDAFVEGNRLLADTPAARRIDRGIFPNMIARLRACFSAEWIAGWTALPEEHEPAPIFLVGFPRSGTTLLDQILDSHPALTTMEEKDALDQVRRAVQQMPGGYPEALAGMNAATLADLRRLYRTEARRHVGNLGGRILVDKMPLNMIDAGLIHRLFPSARILLALRHPCDVVLSCFAQAMQPNAAMVLFDSIPSTARFYAQVMDLWQQYRSVLPASVVSIRYEDLVADLASETRRILDALGLPWDDAVLGYAEHAKSRAISTPSYHQVVQPIYRRSVDRWRNYAFAFDEALPVLRPFIEQFGYASPEPPAA